MLHQTEEPFILFSHDTSEAAVLCSLLAHIKPPAWRLPPPDESEQSLSAGRGMRSVKAAREYGTLLCNPPFGLNKSGVRFENQFLTMCLSLLPAKGRCGCVVPNGWLARNARAEDVAMRRTLAEEYDLRCCILLPGHLFQPSSVRASILFFAQLDELEKGAQRAGEARIYDLRALGARADVQHTLLTLLTLLAEEGADKEIQALCPVTRVKLEQLRQNQYILLPEAYLPTASRRRPDPDEVEARIRSLEEEFAETADSSAIQLSLFETEEQTLQRRRLTALRLAEAYRTRIDGRLTALLEEEAWPLRRGAELFTIRCGAEPVHALPAGPYALYAGSGIQRYVDRPNVTAPLPVLIINRVGYRCGEVHKSQGPCWVGSNAMYVASYLAEVECDFLFHQLRGLNFGSELGSGQPYVRREQLLEHSYSVPPVQAQRAFLASCAKEYERVRMLTQVAQE